MWYNTRHIVSAVHAVQFLETKLLYSESLCESRTKEIMYMTGVKKFCVTCMAIMCVCMVITQSKGMDQPGKVANPARGQLNRKNEYFPVPVRA